MEGDTPFAPPPVDNGDTTRAGGGDPVVLSARSSAESGWTRTTGGADDASASQSHMRLDYDARTGTNTEAGSLPGGNSREQPGGAAFARSGGGSQRKSSASSAAQRPRRSSAGSPSRRSSAERRSPAALSAVDSAGRESDEPRMMRQETLESGRVGGADSDVSASNSGVDDEHRREPDRAAAVDDVPAPDETGARPGPGSAAIETGPSVPVHDAGGEWNSDDDSDDPLTPDVRRSIEAASRASSRGSMGAEARGNGDDTALQAARREAGLADPGRAQTGAVAVAVAAPDIAVIGAPLNAAAAEFAQPSDDVPPAMMRHHSSTRSGTSSNRHDSGEKRIRSRDHSHSSAHRSRDGSNQHDRSGGRGEHADDDGKHPQHRSRSHRSGERRHHHRDHDHGHRQHRHDSSHKRGGDGSGDDSATRGAKRHTSNERRHHAHDDPARSPEDPRDRGKQHASREARAVADSDGPVESPPRDEGDKVALIRDGSTSSRSGRDGKAKKNGKVAPVAVSSESGLRDDVNARTAGDTGSSRRLKDAESRRAGSGRRHKGSNGKNSGATLKTRSSRSQFVPQTRRGKLLALACVAVAFIVIIVVIAALSSSSDTGSTLVSTSSDSDVALRSENATCTRSEQCGDTGDNAALGCVGGQCRRVDCTRRDHCDGCNRCIAFECYPCGSRAFYGCACPT